MTPWTVRYRPHKKHARWRIVGVVETYPEAVALIGSLPAGDWWLSDREPAPAGNDECAAAGGAAAASPSGGSKPGRRGSIT